MATQVISPVGANVDATSTTALFALGTEADGVNDLKWVYVLANSAVTQYMYVTIDKSNGINPGTKTFVDAGRAIGFAQIAFAAAEYGWVARRGAADVLKVKARSSCLPAVALYTTAVAGFLDDTSASQTLVNGVVLTDTATSSGAAEECRVFTVAFPTPSP